MFTPTQLSKEKSSKRWEANIFMQWEPLSRSPESKLRQTVRHWRSSFIRNPAVIASVCFFNTSLFLASFSSLSKRLDEREKCIMGFTTSVEIHTRIFIWVMCCNQCPNVCNVPNWNSCCSFTFTEGQNSDLFSNLLLRSHLSTKVLGQY